METSEKLTKIAEGYKYLYCRSIRANHFLGIVDLEGIHIIKCLSAEDLTYRFETLQESSFYIPGSDAMDLSEVKRLAEIRIRRDKVETPKARKKRKRMLEKPVYHG